MAKVGPQRAAELTGVSKSTIQRAMKTGKISSEMDESGARVIDVSELERAYGLLPPEPVGKTGPSTVELELERAAQTLETERLKMRIKLLEEQLEMARDQVSDLKTQRDSWQRQAQQVLITSQFSQKQAEDMREEIKERDRRAQARRQQELEARAQSKNKDSANANRKPGPIEKAKQDAKSFDIQGLWGKIRGGQPAATAPDQETAAKTNAA